MAPLVLLLVVFAQTPAEYRVALARHYPNLVTNPGMEAPNWFRPELPEGWVDRPNVRRDATVAHAGKASMRISGPGKGYTVRPGGMALVPGTKYVASAWIKTTDARGKGVSLSASTVSGKAATADWIQGTRDWTRVETVFTTFDDPRPSLLRIVWELDGGTAWVDDVSLEPADGEVPVAPAPKIEPAGGRHTGAVLVTLTTELPYAEIRYTVDGTDPDPLSTLYRGPFLLMDRVLLSARALKAGYRDSPTASARFELQARRAGGVPLEPVDWGQEVDRWWAGHLLNPRSPRAWRAAIESPTPRVDVAQVHRGHPQSTTAGIAEALALLPAAGGTLWFPKSHGPYLVTEPEKTAAAYYFTQGAILIQRRGNLHFLSDGAVLQCAWPVFGLASMEYTDRKTFNVPARNFYFRGLEFDGLGRSDIAVNFIHCADVLVDDCTFRNYVCPRVKTPGQLDSVQSWSHHPAPLVATAMTDNIWVRRSSFSGSMWGAYWDGVHNGGLLDCRFPGPYRGGPILIMTNNDMACFSPTQRNAQYIVIAGCDFRAGRAAATLSNSNTLLAGNRAEGLGALMHMFGRGRSNIEPGLVYEFYGNKVLDNTLVGTKTLTAWSGPCDSGPGRPANLVAGNRAEGLDVILAGDPKGGVPLASVLVRGNDLAGPWQPQVRLASDAGRWVRGVELRDNRLTGKPRPLIVDLQGRPLAPPGVRVTAR